jgi:nucleoporin NUP159
VGLVQGPVAVFDATSLFSPGGETVAPLQTFEPTSPGPLRQLAPNPGDIPEQVAILRIYDGSPGSQLVQILDVQKLESVAGWKCGSTPDTVPTSRKFTNPKPPITN